MGGQAGSCCQAMHARVCQQPLNGRGKEGKTSRGGGAWSNMEHGQSRSVDGRRAAETGPSAWIMGGRWLRYMVERMLGRGPCSLCSMITALITSGVQEDIAVLQSSSKFLRHRRCHTASAFVRCDQRRGGERREAKQRRQERGKERERARKAQRRVGRPAKTEAAA